MKNVLIIDKHWFGEVLKYSPGVLRYMDIVVITDEETFTVWKDRRTGIVGGSYDIKTLSSFLKD